ncbi:kinase [Xylanibacter caecicola]|uniref:GHMP family kinase ATP-binding protein n=1 Tax=Xylanibacter caecicola TaxID=2736294 RepID=UPI002584D4A6|nr:kinase [Xylanibacter caecicola]
MIITKTPFRMSFFGGGTDMPAFFNEYGGAVISTTFDKFCYVNVRHMPPFHPYISELVHNRFERVNNIDDIEHPLIRECMRLHDIHEIRLTYEGDLPARTGLGTSSTFAVGMLNAFCALKGKMMSRRKLAEESIMVEREILKEHGGWQDQIAAAYGGLNRIDFHDNDFSVHPIIIHPGRKRELDENLMLFYTGVQRFSSEIQADTFAKPVDKTKQLLDMLALVDEAEKILTDKNTSLNKFGKLLDTTWKLKRGTGSRVSNGSIDELYDIALKSGALGGKLLGAGGGGFLLFYCEKEKQPALIKALEKLMIVPFNFENNGAQVLYYSPQSYSPRKEVYLK